MGCGSAHGPGAVGGAVGVGVAVGLIATFMTIPRHFLRQSDHTINTREGQRATVKNTISVRKKDHTASRRNQIRARYRCLANNNNKTTNYNEQKQDGQTNKMIGGKEEA